MPKEYIEREALIEKLQEVEIGFRHCGVGIASALASGVRAAIEKTKSLPTADVVEVKHGEWSKDQEDVYWGNHLIKRYCSICGGRPYYDRIRDTFILTPYCPYCGAKMDGKDK